MPEGLFTPSQIQIPGIESAQLIGAMVRILPRTRLILNIADTPEQASALARNESATDGAELWYRYFTDEDRNRADDPEFRMGMIRWEFSNLVKAGARFPAETWLDGGGSGFCIDQSGSVLTNYHLVTGEVAHHARESGALNQEVPCRALRAQVARPTVDGGWRWQEADAVYLVSNPSVNQAIWRQDDAPAQLRQDVALLRVDPPPLRTLPISTRQVKVGERVWMAGFPLRTARSTASQARIGYSDADGTLRVSTGQITHVESTGYFTADVDGSMGNSGSPAMDEAGAVVGMFSRAVGNGPRNAFEYGHTQRVFVSAALARSSLGIADDA